MINKAVKYRGMHMWIARHLKAIKCENCGTGRRKLHHANISGKYMRDILDWKILCVPCHSEFDGNSKIPNSKNKEIVKLRANGQTFDSIAQLYRVTRKAVSKRYYKVINQ